MRKILFGVLLAIAFLQLAVAGPDPQAGEQAVIDVLNQGDCKRAIALLSAAAERGEPWAQLRLGWFGLSQECPGVELGKGGDWLARAACYPSTTAWEKGAATTGPAGYFNARSYSREAAKTLVKASYSASSFAYMHYWLKLWISLYPDAADVAMRQDLEARLRKLEALMNAEQMRQAKSLALCEALR